MKNLYENFLSLLNAEKNIHQKIYFAIWFARFCGVNFIPRFVGNEIEANISESLLAADKGFSHYTAENPNILILATSLYKTGGHSRMVEATIESLDECSNLVLTRVLTSDASVVASVKLKVDLTIIDENLDPVERIFKIYTKLLEFKQIILYTHPDDIESAVAIWIDKKLNPGARKYLFINHADHIFSYARGLCDVVLEVSNYGWFIDEKIGLSEKQSFLGIPIFASIDAKNHHPVSSKLIISGGAAYKFKERAGVSLEPFIDYLLSNNNKLVFYLIGPSFMTSPWILKLKLKYYNRFFCIKTMHYLKYRELLKTSAIYIDSFPVTGGTAFTEALLNGLKVVGIEGGISGYGYADKLRVKSKEDFNAEIIKLIALDDSALARQSTVRNIGLKFHSIEAFAERLRSILFNNKKINVEFFTESNNLRGIDALFGNRYYRCPLLHGLSLSAIFKLLKYGIKSNLGTVFMFELFVRIILKRSQRVSS